MAATGALLPYGAAPCPVPPQPVVDLGYVTPGQVTVKASERTMSLSGDDFKVVDDKGALWFRIDAKMFSMSEKRVLSDAAGRPAAGLKKKLVSMHGSWLIYKGGDFAAPVAKVSKKLIALSPSYNVFTGPDCESAKEATYKVKGNILAKKFEVLQGDKVVAKIHKESRFSGVGAFLKAAMTESQSYFVTCEPGVDVAFVVALCCVVDEMEHDQQK